VKADTFPLANYCVLVGCLIYVYILYSECIFISLVTTVSWLWFARLSLFTLPHRRSSLRDPAAQTVDGGIHSAETSFFLSSGYTPHRAATAWAQYAISKLQEIASFI